MVSLVNLILLEEKKEVKSSQSMVTYLFIRILSEITFK